MDKQTRDKINAAIAAVTPEEIAAHAPKPAPEMEGRGEVVLLMPLSRRLQRYYVAARLAQKRQQNRILRFVKEAVKAMKVELQPVLDLLFSDKPVEGSDGAQFVDVLGSVRGKIADAIEGVETSSFAEAEKIDLEIVTGFTRELRQTLTARMNREERSIRYAEYGVFAHDGQWGVFMTGCNCPGCTTSQLLDKMLEPMEVPQDVIDKTVADFLEEYPGSVRLTSVDGLDLSDHDGDEARERVLARIANDLANGNIVFDLGAGNVPRFHSIELVGLGGTIDLSEMLGAAGSIFGPMLGGIIPDMVMRAMSDDEESPKSDAPPRRRGPFSFLRDLVTGG